MNRKRSLFFLLIICLCLALHSLILSCTLGFIIRLITMIQIDFASLELADIEKVIFGDDVEISDISKRRVDDSFDFLKDFSKNKIIYGINTGFGPMAQYKIEEEEQIALQYNLIRSHASGSGAPLDDIYVRASMLARLNTLSLGYSGVNRSALEVLIQLINHEVTP